MAVANIAKNNTGSIVTNFLHPAICEFAGSSILNILLSIILLKVIAHFILIKYYNQFVLPFFKKHSLINLN